MDNIFSTYRIMFDKFDETVKSYLSKALNSLGLQYSNSQIFAVIFNGIKGVMQNMLFYIEDALTEQNAYTAIRKKSVYSLAKISGYDAYYGSAATGTLVGKTHVSTELLSKTTKIYIPNNAVVVNTYTNVTYILRLPTDYYVIDLSKPLVTHEFKILQGYIDEAHFVAEGNSLESMDITGIDLIDKQYIKVTVDGQEWKQVSTLYDMTEEGEEYVCQTGYENDLTIMFGNAIYGKKLKQGQTVIISFLRHSGVTGNIMSDESTEFKFNSSGYDTFGNKIDINNYMKLTMSNCISGGNNSDTIEFIRNMIGKNSRSLVLASRDNFELFFKRFSFIGNVNCWTESNSMCIIAACTKNIMEKIKEPEDYYNLSKKDIFLDEYEKEMIQNTLENSKKSFAGVTLKFEDPIVRKFAIICYVKVNNIYEKDIVKQNINNYLSKYFLRRFVNTQFIAKSDLIKYLLDNIPQIVSLDLTIYSELAENAFYDNYYYKYIFKEINGTFNYIKKKIIYENNTTPGIDTFGNISLDSKLELPMLGKIKYYPDKNASINAKDNVIYMDAVQVYFT